MIYVYNRWLCIVMENYVYIYIYMVIDPYKEFELRRPFLLCWEPSRKFFLRVRESCLFRESFGKVGYYVSLSLYIHHSLLRASTSCRPGVRQWYRTFTFPFIGSSQASKGEAAPQPNTSKYHGLEAHPCTCRWYRLTLLSEVSRNKLHMQQPSFQKWGFARAKHQGPLLCLWCAPCWWGLRIGVFSRNFRESFAKERAKVKAHLEGSGPVRLATKVA